MSNFDPDLEKQMNRGSQAAEIVSAMDGGQREVERLLEENEALRVAAQEAIDEGDDWGAFREPGEVVGCMQGILRDAIARLAK